MRNLLMIAAFAVFTACASQSDTDVGETTPQNDQGTVDANDTDKTQGQRPEDGTPPTTDESTTSGETTTPPSTGYEPQPSTADTMNQMPPADTATGADTSSTTIQPSTGTWGDTSSTTTPPSTGTTTDTMMTTAPDSL
jgi:hypothetical protein